MRIKIVIWMVALQIMMACTDSMAQDSALHIKAAFIYKFCGYTTWPSHKFANDYAPIRVGVAGQQRVIDELSRVFAGKTIQGRSLAVYKVDTDSDLAALHLLYVNESSHLDLFQFAVLHRQEPILTITEKGSLAEFAIINFIPYEDYIRFQISRTQAERVGLEISSQLLSVAQLVK